MAIKNGRYKDKNGNVRHFETNENMVVVDNGQKTLKQKLASLLESLSDLVKRFTTHETSETAHEDIRSEVEAVKTGKSDVGHTHADLSGKISGLELTSYKLKGAVPDNTNLNTLTDGVWMLNALFTYTNSPINGSYGVIYVYDKIATIYEINSAKVFTTGHLGLPTVVWNEMASTIDALKSYSHQDIDLNAWFEQGSFLAVGANVKNKPPTNGWGHVISIKSGTGAWSQEWFDSDGIRSWRRLFNGSSWGAWQQIATTSITDTKADKGYGSYGERHVITQDDPDTVSVSKVFTTNNGTSLPKPYDANRYWHIVCHMENDTSYGYQIAQERYGSSVWIRYKKVTWQPWLELSTNTTYTPTGLNGWVVTGLKVIKNGSTVTINGAISSGTVTAGTVIMSGLPSSNQSAVFEFYSGSVQSVGSGYITPSGTMLISQAPTSGIQLFLNVTYTVA